MVFEAHLGNAEYGGMRKAEWLLYGGILKNMYCNKWAGYACKAKKPLVLTLLRCAKAGQMH